MNTPERNQKNAEKLKKFGKVYSDGVEDKATEFNQSLENATKEYPFPTARKVAWVTCGGFWIFCAGGLLFGVNMNAMFPFLFFSLAAVDLVHIPTFIVKKKMFDVFAGSLFALGCMGVAVSMLVR
ncbi:MAG: hypothetical protein FWF82_01150 [Oscillospiraceae bacterium]|nr:hypothetical protein [Oscillospiraceae bacterium]